MNAADRLYVSVTGVVIYLMLYQLYEQPTVRARHRTETVEAPRDQFRRACPHEDRLVSLSPLDASRTTNIVE